MAKLCKYWKIFCYAFAAGMMIGVGGIVYLASPDKVVGAVLFAVGLLTICTYGLKLFTGAIGYLITDRSTSWVERLATAGAVWLGNLVATDWVGWMIHLLRPELADKAKVIVDAKMSAGYASVLVMAVFCGILMYLAVDIYRNRSGIYQLIGIFVAVPVFILAGFEHSIANMFYMAAGYGHTVFSVEALVFLLVVTCGNAAGSVVLAYFPHTKSN